MKIKGNKKDFVRSLSKKLNFSNKETNEIVDKFFSCLGEFLFQEPYRVSFAGKITLSSYERKSRIYKHPKTKEEIFFPKQKSIKFKIGEEWKKSLTKISNI